MIFIDSETTGLLKSTATSLAFQPHLVELYAVKLTDDYEFVAEIDTYIKPPVPLSEGAQRVNKITEEMLVGAPAFVQVVDKIVDLFIGERIVVGHNISFDMGVLWSELARLELELHFPWPPTWHCTVELAMPIEQRRLTLKRLYEIATGETDFGAHRAKNDVIATVKCYQWLQKNGFIDA